MNNMNNKGLKRFFLFFAIFFLLWASFGAGIYLSGKGKILDDFSQKQALYVGKVLGKYSEKDGGVLSQDVDFSLFWDVWRTLSENYVDQEKINEKKMFYGAIRGMVSAIGDPYTVFMNPKNAKEFSDDLKGTFEGIGAEIGMKNEILTIIAPLPDMPAQKAGLRSGDKVLAIDGESSSGIYLDEAVNKIRGPKGTEVVLTIKREGAEEAMDIAITRGKIIVKSVRTGIEDGIFTLKITNFNEDTAVLFNEAVNEVIENDPKGIILDLRSNPGGFLDTAIEVASEWVEDKTVVSEKFSSGFVNEHLARGRARLKNYQTVVLVNGGSASASEIVSGALQDYGLAEVVGEKTFGKGSVQTLNKFSDGSSVKVTVAKWLTPNGRSINDEGIEPDYRVDLTLEDYNDNLDPQKEAAVKLIEGGDISPYLATGTEDIIN